MKTISVATEFYPRLANRDERQDDGSHNAVIFREKFLKELITDPKHWENDECFIVFDFLSVDILGPSFANEAFAYFTKSYKPEKILSKICFINISRIKMRTIKKELSDGYSR